MNAINTGMKAINDSIAYLKNNAWLLVLELRWSCSYWSYSYWSYWYWSGCSTGAAVRLELFDWSYSTGATSIRTGAEDPFLRSFDLCLGLGFAVARQEILVMNTISK